MATAAVNEIKIISWNGSHESNCGSTEGFMRFQEQLVEKIIKKCSADYYLCFQEVGMKDKFQTRMKEDYNVKIHYNKRHKVAIVWKATKSEVKQNLSDEEKCVRYAEVEFNKFVLVCCHAPHKLTIKEKIDTLKKFVVQKKDTHQTKTVILAGDFNLGVDELQKSIKTFAYIFKPKGHREGQRKSKEKIDLFIQVKNTDYDHICKSGIIGVIPFDYFMKKTEASLNYIFPDYDVIERTADNLQEEIEDQVELQRKQQKILQEEIDEEYKQLNKKRHMLKEAEIKMKESQHEYYRYEADYWEVNPRRRARFDEDYTKYKQAKQEFYKRKESYDVAIFKDRQVFHRIEEAEGELADIQIEKTYNENKFQEKINHLFKILDHDIVSLQIKPTEKKTEAQQK